MNLISSFLFLSVHKEAVSAGKTLLKLLLPTGFRMFHSPSILKYYLSLWIFLPEKEFCKKPILARSKQKNKSILDFIFKILISNFLPLKKFLNVIFHFFLPAEIEKGKRLQCTFHNDRLQKHYLLLFRDIVKYLRTWSETIKKKIPEVSIHQNMVKNIQPQNSFYLYCKINECL